MLGKKKANFLSEEKLVGTGNVDGKGRETSPKGENQSGVGEFSVPRNRTGRRLRNSGNKESKRNLCRRRGVQNLPGLWSDVTECRERCAARWKTEAEREEGEGDCVTATAGETEMKKEKHLSEKRGGLEN